ncbi:MAG: hypothetical protein ACKO1J_12810 [Tagaea sp.]
MSAAKSLGYATLGLFLTGAVALWLTQGPGFVTQLWATLCL